MQDTSFSEPHDTAATTTNAHQAYLYNIAICGPMISQRLEPVPADQRTCAECAAEKKIVGYLLSKIQRLRPDAVRQAITFNGKSPRVGTCLEQWRTCASTLMATAVLPRYNSGGGVRRAVQLTVCSRREPRFARSRS